MLHDKIALLVNKLCRDAVRYCFGPVIQTQLQRLVTEWNHHRIRKSSRAEAPGGIPEDLFFCPDASGIVLSYMSSS